VSEATVIGGALRTRVEEGGTPALERWGINSEYGVLRDVLLGSADGFSWLGEENAQYSALVRESLRKGRRFDHDLALRQYAEMVDAYRDAGVAVHFLEARDELAYGVYARDSSFMTPFGAVICQLANPRRRGEYATTLRFYLENAVPVYDLVSAGNFEGGDFNLIERGCVLVGYTGGRSEEVAAKQVGGWMEREGLEVKYAPIDEFYVHIDLWSACSPRSWRPSASTRPSPSSSTGCVQSRSRSCP
jgi:N-dimethylarginine dimethylaminohydrolase